jgi:hypothetical protein
MPAEWACSGTAGFDPQHLKADSSVRNVVHSMLEEFLESVEHLNMLVAS